jgi:hypothetical protein
MPSRTQLVCLHEGEKGAGIDGVFINRLMKSLKPVWIRAEERNKIRLVPCGGRTDLIEQTPQELRRCLDRGADTTLMVWADMDDDMPDSEALKEEFWRAAQRHGISREEFETIVFVFAKDRLENWIEYLRTGQTDEAREAPRVSPAVAAEAARTLAERCQRGDKEPPLPPSLLWSCTNWRRLVNRFR